MNIEVVKRISDIASAEWDALCGFDNPFIEHAFLRLLEDSKCTGPRTPWQPRHLIARADDGGIVAAMPCYLRSDSYGEYIFDWSWAQAAERAGMPYYPKLTSAVPFVPATGPRVLVKAGVDVNDARLQLGRALVELAEEVGASSTHVLFCRDDEDQSVSNPPLESIDRRAILLENSTAN